LIKDRRNNISICMWQRTKKNNSKLCFRWIKMF
jgi:hypothetical protein